MKTCRFSKKERLLRPPQFKSVYQYRRVKKNAYLWLYFMPNGLGYNRLGISVSNKLCTSLVQRNKIKRIIRQVFRLNKKIFGSGVDIVCVLKNRPSNLKYDVFRNLIINLGINREKNSVNFNKNLP